MIGRLRSISVRSSWSKSHSRRPCYAPAIECLEDRCLLSAGYIQTNLISDLPNLARFTDTNVINPWGISVDSSGPFWLANNRTGTSTLNDGGGASPSPTPLIVNVPGSQPTLVGRPTGTVFHEGPGFAVGKDGKSAPSLFLFATQEGTISGWSPRVDLLHAFVAVDASTTPGSGPIFTGLAAASTTAGSFLYAANFRSGTIDVFDESFHAVHKSGAFADPSLPRGFVPFNVQELGGLIYVAYTMQEAGRYSTGIGPGNGFVDVFDPQGDLIRRVASQGPLDTPWGLALAPGDFGKFSDALLVGNFANGRINAFDPESGTFLGTLQNATGEPVVIPGLWALNFGNDGQAGPANELYFTAGIGQEQHGLFGALEPAIPGVPVVPQPSIDAALAANPPQFDPDDSDYPLPPSQGPKLRNGAAQPEQEAVLLPLQASPASIIPTLLTSSSNGANSADNLSAAANRAVQASPNNAIADSSLASLLPAKPNGTDSGSAAQRARLAVLDLLSGPEPDTGGAPRVRSNVRSEPRVALDGVEAVRAPAVRREDAEVAVAVRSDEAANASLDSSELDALAVSLQKKAPVERTAHVQPAVAAIPNSLPPTPEPRAIHPWHVTAPALLLVLLAGYGIQFTWARRILAAPRALGKIKSLWKRSTRHSNKTVVLASQARKNRAEVKTIVITPTPS